MPESSAHARLVAALIQWMALECQDGVGAVLVDTAGVPAASRPPKIGGFVPDAYAVDVARRIVGEAKTAADLENRHSLSQIRAFVAFCSQTEDAFFVLAVPWYRVAYAKNLISQMCKRAGLAAGNCRVLENLPG